MRAIGFAALSFGAVVALSATFGMSYRSTAAPLDAPTASVTDTAPVGTTDAASPTSDAASPTTDAATPTDTATPSDSATPTDSASPSTESTTPSADASPSDAPSPSDSSAPTPAGFAPAFHAFSITTFSATNPAYTFSEPNSVDVSFDLEANSDSGSITFGAADPATGADLSTSDPTCLVDTGVTHQDCTLAFESPDSGLWHLVATQDDVDLGPQTQDAYVYIPPAPTITDLATDEGGQPQGYYGTGIAGDTVDILNSAGDTVCETTVSGGSGEGDWTCNITPGEYDFSQPVTARQIDAGDTSADGVNYTITITPGGISLSSATFQPAAPLVPVMSYSLFPGGFVINGTPTGGADTVITEVDGWAPGGEGSFPTSYLCNNVTVYSPSGATPCTFTPTPNPPDSDFSPEPLSGWYNPYSHQTGEGGEVGDYADDYFFIPAAPAISKVSAASTGVVTLSGSGVPTDGIRVIVDGSTPACASTTVAANGAWSCKTAALRRGTHTFQAYDVDLGAGRNDALRDADSSIVYKTGGLSALSATASVRVVSSTTTEAPSPTPTATDFANWFFTITGVDLNNVHPGDTFTVTGTGLPPGSTVSGELHSKAVSIGSAVVQPDGSFTLPVTVPADFPAGAHTIVMTLTPPGAVPAESQQPLKVVTTSDSSGAGEAQQPSDAPSPLGSSEGPGIDHHGPNSNILTHGLQSIADVVAHPAKIPAAIEIGLVLLIFAVLPGHLLNATLAEQYERFTKRREQRKRGPGRWARFHAFLNRTPFVAGLALTTATALLFGFADPRFGFSLASLRLFLGLAIALALVSYLTNAVVSRIMRGRWKVDVEVNLRPLGLILTVVGVVVSRLFDFSPGFLIGLVLGLVISEKQLAKHAWRAVLLRTSILLGLALLAWFAFSLFDAKEEGGTFASELAIETLVAITTEAVVGLMVELLPLKLLEGEKLYEKSKVIWGALYLLTVVIFVVAVVPWEGNWAELGSSLWTWIGIVVGFGIVATGVYLYFRIRGNEEHDEHVITDADADDLVPIASEDEQR